MLEKRSREQEEKASIVFPPTLFLVSAQQRERESSASSKRACTAHAGLYHGGECGECAPLTLGGYDAAPYRGMCYQNHRSKKICGAMCGRSAELYWVQWNVSTMNAHHLPATFAVAYCGGSLRMNLTNLRRHNSLSDFSLLIKFALLARLWIAT